MKKAETLLETVEAIREYCLLKRKPELTEADRHTFMRLAHELASVDQVEMLICALTLSDKYICHVHDFLTKDQVEEILASWEEYAHRINEGVSVYN